MWRFFLSRWPDPSISIFRFDINIWCAIFGIRYNTWNYRLNSKRLNYSVNRCLANKHFSLFSRSCVYSILHLLAEWGNDRRKKSDRTSMWNQNKKQKSCKIFDICQCIVPNGIGVGQIVKEMYINANQFDLLQIDSDFSDDFLSFPPEYHTGIVSFTLNPARKKKPDAWPNQKTYAKMNDWKADTINAMNKNKTKRKKKSNHWLNTGMR